MTVIYPLRRLARIDDKVARRSRNQMCISHVFGAVGGFLFGYDTGVISGAGAS